jgi:hypothetical protein
MAQSLSDVFGKRYGEVLLVRSTQSGPEATVFNSFPLTDCPQELWSKLDPQVIAHRKRRDGHTADEDIRGHRDAAQSQPQHSVRIRRGPTGFRADRPGGTALGYADVERRTSLTPTAGIRVPDYAIDLPRAA